MGVFLTIHQEDREVGEISISCPACGVADTEATVIRRIETVKLVYLVPIWSSPTTWVECSACATRLYSKLDAESLLSLPPEQVADAIRVRESLVRQSLAVIAVVMAVFPLLNFVMAAIAIFANRQSRGWPKTLSYVALGLSIAATIGLGLLIVFDPWRPH